MKGHFNTSSAWVLCAQCWGSTTIAALFFFVQLQRQRWLLDHFVLLPQWWAFFFHRKIKRILLKAVGKACLKELVLNQDIWFLSSQPRFENHIEECREACSTLFPTFQHNSSNRWLRADSEESILSGEEHWGETPPITRQRHRNSTQPRSH